MKKLLLVHGAIGAADQLIQLKEILETEFDVHLLEFDGHGKKASTDKPFSLENFIFQFESALESIGEPSHVFGYSMGGFVSLLSAATGNKNILTVTTLGTKMRWTPEIASQESKNLDPELIKQKVPQFAKALSKRHGDYWERVLKRTSKFMSDLGEKQPIKQSAMKQISMPVQLCLADGDRMVSKEETVEVENWIAESLFLEIPQSKHPIEQVNLMALANAIRSFIHQNE